jgi:hypothetical protein
VLARGADLDAEAIGETERFVSLKAVVRLFELAGQACKDDAFGLQYAQCYPLGPDGIYHYIVTNSPTVRDALVSGVRYVRLLTDVEDGIMFHERGGVGYFRWKAPPGLGPRAQFTDYVVVLLVETIRSMLQRQSWMPLRLEFDHKKPTAITKFRSEFGRRLSFDNEITCVVIDAVTLVHQLDRRTLLSIGCSGTSPPKKSARRRVKRTLSNRR